MLLPSSTSFNIWVCSLLRNTRAVLLPVLVEGAILTTLGPFEVRDEVRLKDEVEVTDEDEDVAVFEFHESGSRRRFAAGAPDS